MDQTAIQSTILALLARRRPGASICPSEAARYLTDEWRPLMPDVRAAAADLAGQGRLIVMQKGHPVDPATAKGPIRLALPFLPG